MGVHLHLVYDRNHYFGLGQIAKPKLADTVTDTETKFQGENPVSNFFHQRTPKTKFVAKY